MTVEHEPSARAEAMADARSLPGLLSKLFNDLTDLFRKEGQLIRAEISDKVTQIETGLGLIVASAVCLLVSLVVLTGAVVAALGQVIGAGWAALVVGIVLAAVGLILAQQGRASLSTSNLTPDRSTEQIRRDAELAREQVQ